MKTVSSEIVNESKLLYSQIYTVLYKKADNDILCRVQENNQNTIFDDKSILYVVLGCYVNVRVNHVYDIIFNAENIEQHECTIGIIKKVFALGYKSIDEIPSTWSVVAQIEFPNGVPNMLLDAEENDKFYLTSQESWKLFLNLKDAKDKM